MKKKKGDTNNIPKQQDKHFYDAKKYEDKLDEIADRIDRLQKDFASYRQYTSMKFELVFVYLQGMVILLRYSW